MDDDVLQDLSRVISDKQATKLAVSRSGVLIALAMEKHRDWLALQDIPTPRIRQPWKWKPRSPILASPERVTSTKDRRPSCPSPVTSPDLHPTPSSTTLDEIFTMDDDVIPPTIASSSALTPKMSRPMTPLDLHAASQVLKGPVWKSRTVESEKYVLLRYSKKYAADYLSELICEASWLRPLQQPNRRYARAQLHQARHPLLAEQVKLKPALRRLRRPPQLLRRLHLGALWSPARHRSLLSKLNSRSALLSLLAHRPGLLSINPRPSRIECHHRR